MQNLLSLAFVILIIPVSVIAAFSDVPNSYPYQSAVEYVQQQGIVSGYPDGTFKPDNPINRAEFTKILMGTFSMGGTDFARCDEDKSFNRQARYFTDVSSDQWYGFFVCRAKESGFISGYADGSFRPGSFITFAEAAKIITLTKKASDLEPPPPNDDGPWYGRYVRFLSDAHSIPTSIIRLDQPITRGEMAEIIWRLKAGVTDQPSKTYEDLQGTAFQSVLEQIEQWTPGIHWSAIQSIIFPNSIGVDGTLTIPARSVESQVITVPQWNVTRKLDPNLIQNGWTEDQYLAADGVTGSQWGYQKREGDTLRFLIFREDSSQCTANVDAPGATCAYHETNVFYTAPVRSDFRTYSNQNDNFSISLPQNWEIHLLNKPELLPSTFSTITGTKFQDPNAQAFVFVGITPTCPDISIDSAYHPSVTATTIDGKIFDTAGASDGAAGSVGEEMFYTSKIDATRCIFIASLYFHSTGEALDEPQRSITKAEIAQEKALIEQVVHSLKFQ